MMEGVDKADLVKKLSLAKEELDVLRCIFRKEKEKVEQKEKLANKAWEAVTDALFELTGDEFYRRDKK